MVVRTCSLRKIHIITPTHLSLAGVSPVQHVHALDIVHSVMLMFIVILDLGLAQIFPMTDELTGAEPRVVSASFATPYILLVRDDASIFILRCDEDGDLEEVERSDSLLATRWLSGCLYQDWNSRFGPRYMNGPNQGGRRPANLMMFLLSADGGLYVSCMWLVGLPDSRTDEGAGVQCHIVG